MDWKNTDLIKTGWRVTKAHLWTLVGILLLSYLFSYLGQVAHVSSLVSVFISFVLASVFLRLSRGHVVNFKNLFDDVSGMKLLHCLIASFIVGVFFIVGLALFIIPGIIVAVMLAFVTYILVDEDKKVTWRSKAFWTAIKKSVAMTKGVRWKLFVFFLVLLGINLLGALALGVGLLVTVPISGIAMATLYDRLKNAAAPLTVEPIGNVLPPPPSETVS
jgi:uncharacterized membrane protein